LIQTNSFAIETKVTKLLYSSTQPEEITIKNVYI